MNKRFGYVISAWMIIIIIAVVGCTKPAPLPTKPPTTSDDQANCVNKCLMLRDCCIKSCNWVDTSCQLECRNNCVSDLGQCYETCEWCSYYKVDWFSNKRGQRDLIITSTTKRLENNPSIPYIELPGVCKIIYWAPSLLGIYICSNLYCLFLINEI